MGYVAPPAGKKGTKKKERKKTSLDECSTVIVTWLVHSSLVNLSVAILRPSRHA